MEPKKGKSTIIKFDQRRVMVQFVRENPCLFNNQLQGPHGDVARSALWTELANRLNAMAGPSKDADKWHKSFLDWRSAVKTKALALKKFSRGTGGGREPSRLNDLEEICAQEFLGSVSTEGLTQVIDTLEDLDEPASLPAVPLASPPLPTPQTVELMEDPDKPAIPTSSAKRPSFDAAQERKRIRKRLQKEEELDLENSNNTESITCHLEHVKKQTESLEGIRTTLERIADALEVIAQATRTNNIFTVPLE